MTDIDITETRQIILSKKPFITRSSDTCEPKTSWLNCCTIVEHDTNDIIKIPVAINALRAAIQLEYI